MSAIKIKNLTAINQHVIMELLKHKFEKLVAITVTNLKFQPIIDQTRMFTDNVAKCIGLFKTFMYE